MIVMEKKKTNMIWQHPNLIANYMHSLLLNDAVHNDNYTTHYTAAAVTRDLPHSPLFASQLVYSNINVFDTF